MSARFERLHVEAVGGIAGDMALAALCDLGADVGAIERALASLAIDGLSLEVDRVEVSGERACRVRSIAPADEPHHRQLEEVLSVIERADTTLAARERARRVFEILAAAEATVHGGSSGSVHLHEVGQLDSVLDVLGIAVALDSLGNPEVTCTPLPVGHGSVQTSHGRLAVPVPAVQQIAASVGVPLVEIDVEGETVTPTGIAVVAEASKSWGQRPAEDPAATGVGAGTRRFPNLPNVVRVHGYGSAL
jgi:uncharacterized protein (DUF111 family)